VSRDSVLVAILLLFSPLYAAADTPDEDEARIEVLIRAEKAGLAAVPAAAAPTPPDAVAVAAPAPVPAPVSTTSPVAADPAPAATTPVAAGVPYASLKDHVGEKVRVVLKSGTEHFAQLESVDARQITLAVPSFEYTAQFSVPREQIARVELR